ncbi:MerR family transcriptional regulator [Singulisphaera sp. GP187]|uniref:helix-turn-helix domain-containing protein n=1 Tax=Singulisphaera sp. GP187 TaxID=1882752 RepID=UPI0009414655|nr:MerR family transcriptional regulator [Singulisphaera sp. GP187]
MKANPEPLWTIDELGSKAAEALAFDYDGPPNDRVRDVPDRRTIRYYTTLGMIDRAAEIRGRTAYYGARHLMQLAAIKRLQARGLSLADVQRQIVGLTDAGLAQLARLPAGMNLGSASGPEPAAPFRAEDSAFWKETPAPLAKEKRSEEIPVARAMETPPPLQGIRLGEQEATLLITPIRPVVAEDIEAIRKAAGPLLRLLTKRGLIGSPSGKGTGDR